MGHRSAGTGAGAAAGRSGTGWARTGWAGGTGRGRPGNGDWSVGPDRRFQALPYQPCYIPPTERAHNPENNRQLLRDRVGGGDDRRRHAVATDLLRSYEVIVADRVKFRAGRIVFLAFSRDEKTMGFGFPKEERELLVSSEPHKFQMPSTSDMRYNWAHVRLEAIGHDEMRELVLDAWQMVVPKKVAAQYLERRPGTGPP